MSVTCCKREYGGAKTTRSLLLKAMTYDISVCLCFVTCDAEHSSVNVQYVHRLLRYILLCDFFLSFKTTKSAPHRAPSGSTPA